MSQVEVLNWSAEKLKELEVKKALFEEKLNSSLLHEVVQWQLARRRKGDHNVKNRRETRGGGKKPFRQKGTGRARQGSIRSPLLKGGAVAHGPQKRSYDWALPKKVRQKALRNVLSYMFQEKKLIFVENMEMKSAKTKELALRFKKMKWDKALLVDEINQMEFKRACKNLKNFKVIPSKALNVYDILKLNRVVFTPQVLETVYKKCGIL
ncbi:MAG: 50S ribosomal protein L4 [Bdellovibrionales bacterium]|nr:50S ribosomal protein L4 [Bdellovibrionales bacterium]